MKKERKISDFTDMSNEELQACFKKVNMEEFIKDPTQALIAVGATFKPGITFKFVENETEINNLPSNVIPLRKPNQQLSSEELNRVAGGGEGYYYPPDYEDWRGKY
jgi:hypothetical protein